VRRSFDDMEDGDNCKDWFEEQFGFVETAENIQEFFQFDVARKELKSSKIGKSFLVGEFETPSVFELQEKIESLSPSSPNLGCLSFENIIGDATELHLAKENAGSVFQVASQFNCLEMTGPKMTPEMGITIYENDRTQGPRCAMACPAATVFRNYFWNGRGQVGGNTQQINTAKDLDALLGNEKGKYWSIQNGYMMPSTPESMKEIGEKISDDECLRENIFLGGRVGVQWSTEVATGDHCVTQVFCSAVPITYSQTGRGTKPRDWRPLAEIILESAYQATLLTGAILAAKQGKRVSVFLTMLGGGAFGNPGPWICAAMKKALLANLDKPLDVKLVNYGRIPSDNFVMLEQIVKDKTSD